MRPDDSVNILSSIFRLQLHHYSTSGPISADSSFFLISHLIWFRLGLEESLIRLFLLGTIINWNNWSEEFGLEKILFFDWQWLLLNAFQGVTRDLIGRDLWQ